MHTIICFNGPAGSGKDSLADELLDLWTVDSRPGFKYKFAQPIRDHICGVLGVSDVELEYMKPLRSPIFGKTIREAMIDYSEKFMKPQYGDAVFGRIMRDRILKLRYPSLICITDCGFESEMKLLAGSLGSKNRIVLVRVHRDGYTFEGDSRSYVNPAAIPNLHSYTTHHNITPFEDSVQNLVTKLNLLLS